MPITICRLYNARSDASRVVLLLQMAGVSTFETSIVANNSEGWYKPPPTRYTAHSIAAAAGIRGNEDAAVGATMRATAMADGSLVTLLAFAGVGVVVAAGWFAAVLGGITVSGLPGGLQGGLVRAGVPEEEAQVLAEGVRRGGALVVVRVQPVLEPHVVTLMDHWSVNLQERSDLYCKAGWQPFDVNAKPYTADQVRCERILHSQAMSPKSDRERLPRSGSRP